MASSDVQHPVSTYHEADGAAQTLLFLNDLRLNGGQLCDARLLVNGKRHVAAHRAILAANSDYFASIYTGKAAVSADTVVPINDLNDPDFDALLDFAYTKQVRISEANVHSLFQAADCLRFPGVKKACFKHLRRQLDTDNCVSMWAFAEGHNNRELSQAAFEMVEKNFKDVVSGLDFRSLDARQVSKVLASDNLAVEQEEQVYEAAMSWVKVSELDRARHVSVVMQSVRLQLLDHDYLLALLDNATLLTQDLLCIKQLLSAIEFKVGEQDETIARVRSGSNGGDLVDVRTPVSLDDPLAVPRRPSVQIEVSDGFVSLRRHGNRPGQKHVKAGMGLNATEELRRSPSSSGTTNYFTVHALHTHIIMEIGQSFKHGAQIRSQPGLWFFPLASSVVTFLHAKLFTTMLYKIQQ